MQVSEQCNILKYTDDVTQAISLHKLNTTSWSNSTQVLVSVNSSKDIGTDDDLMYYVKNKMLYHYNTTTHQYDWIKNISTSYPEAKVYSNGDRMVVVTNNDSIQYSGQHAHYCFYSVFVLLKTSTGVVQIDKFDIDQVKGENGVDLIKVFVSPNITKVMVVSEHLNGQPNLTVKHIDYTQQTALPLNFNHSHEFLHMINKVNWETEVYLGDSYMVARNGSLFRLSALYNRALEVAFQFVGIEAIFLKSRDISINLPINGTYNNTNNTDTCNITMNPICIPIYQNPYFDDDQELGRFSSIWIDNSLSNRLSVLGMFRVLNQHNYSVEAINYGNLISTFNVSKPVQPAYVYFIEPASVVYQADISMGDHFQWTYLIHNTTTNTSEVTVKKIDDNSIGHLASDTFTVSNSWDILAHSKMCVIITNNAQDVKMFRLNSTSQTYSEDIVTNLTTLLASNTANHTTASEWSISEDCSRFKVKQTYFFRNSSGNWNLMNNSTSSTSFAGMTQDSTFTYAVSLDGNLYKYSTTLLGFELFYTPVTPLPNATHINLYSNRLILNHTTASSAEVYVYQIGNTAAPVFNLTNTSFSASPVIAISPQLTKIIILGNGGTVGS